MHFVHLVCIKFSAIFRSMMRSLENIYDQQLNMRLLLIVCAIHPDVLIHQNLRYHYIPHWLFQRRPADEFDARAHSRLGAKALYSSSVCADQKIITKYKQCPLTNQARVVTVMDVPNCVLQWLWWPAWLLAGKDHLTLIKDKEIAIA